MRYEYYDSNKMMTFACFALLGFFFSVVKVNFDDIIFVIIFHVFNESTSVLTRIIEYTTRQMLCDYYMVFVSFLFAQIEVLVIFVLVHCIFI